MKELWDGARGFTQKGGAGDVTHGQCGPVRKALARLARCHVTGLRLGPEIIRSLKEVGDKTVGDSRHVGRVEAQRNEGGEGGTPNKRKRILKLTKAAEVRRKELGKTSVEWKLKQTEEGISEDIRNFRLTTISDRGWFQN